MIRAVYFNETTGEIVRIQGFDDGTDVAVIDALTPEDCVWIDSATADMDDRIDDPAGTPTVTSRPSLYDDEFVDLEPDGSDSVSITLPDGTTVTPDDGEAYTTSGETTFEFTASEIGEWVYDFDPPWPYLPLTLTITAGLALIGGPEIGTIGDDQIAGLSAAKITGQLTSSQIADAAVTTAKFASGIKPVEIFATTAAAGTASEGRVIFVTADNKLYRGNGTIWTAAVATTDLSGTIADAQLAGIAASKVTGQLTNAQLADIAAAKVSGQLTNAQLADIAASKITGQIADSQIAAVAAAKVSGQLTNSQIADIAATKLTGTIVASQIADGAISAAKMASGISIIERVATLPTTGNYAGRVVFLTTDSKLYRYNGTSFVASVPTSDLSGTIADAQLAGIAASKITGQLSDAQLSEIAATKLTGQVVAAQIADAAISVAKLANNLSIIERVATLPTTGNYAGRFVFLTTDNKLYRYNGTSFVASVPTSDLSGTIADAQLAGIAAAKITGTLTNAQIADVAAAKVSGQLTNAQLADIDAAKLTGTIAEARLASIAAAKITGTLTNAQIATLDAAKLTGAIVGTQIADDAITTPKLAAGAVTASEIAAGAIIAGKIATGAIVAADIAAGTITGAKIATDTITASNVAAGAIGASEIAAGAVVAGKIAAGTIVAADIAASTITGTKIAADTITGANLVAGTITASEIAASTITGTQIAAGTITGAKIAAGTIQASNITAGTITGDKIAGNTITASNIAADTITAGQIAAGAIGASEIAANAVVAGKIAAGTIVAADIAAGTITGAKIAADTITGANLVAGTVTAGEIAASTITGTQIAAGTITGAKIAAGTIQASNIAADTITGDKIAANTITASEIAANTITAGEIAASAIGTAQLAANSVVASKIFLGDTSNMVRDPTLTDLTVWGATGGTPSTVATGAVQASSANRLVVATASSGIIDIYSLVDIPVEQGKPYFVSAVAGPHDGASCTIETRISWYSMDSAGAVTWLSWDLIGSKTGTTFQESADIATAPAGARRAQIVVRKIAGSTASLTMMSPIVRRASSGELIVDGAITAAKIAALTITSDKIGANQIIADKIAAGSIGAEKLAIGSGANMLTNTDILAGKLGWVYEWSDAPASFQFNVRTDTYAAGGAALEIVQTNGNLVDSYGIMPVDPSGNPLLSAVTANKWYELSVYYLGHRADGLQMYIRWFDSAGVQLPEPNRNTSVGVFPANQGTNPDKKLSNYLRAWGKAQAPAGAVYALPFFRHLGTIQGAGYTSSYLWLKRFFFAEANANQTEPTPWSEGGLTFIQGGNIVTGAITANHIAAATITGDKIVGNTITAANIAASTITGTNIAAQTITGDNIVSDTIVARNIAAGTITATEIAASTITGAKIAAGTIQALNIAAGTITGDRIAGNTITADKLVANSITAGQIASGAIATDELAAGAVRADKIAVGAISENLILDQNFESGDLTLWPGTGGTATVVGNTTSPSGGKVMSLDRGVTNNTVSMNRAYANFIPVDGGKQYRGEFNILGPSASAAGAYLRVLYYDANKAAVNDPATSLSYRDLYGNGAIPSAWTTYGQTFTMPTAAKYVKLQVFHHSTSTVAVMLVSSVSFRKMITGELIVNGGITASHISSYSLTAANATLGDLTVNTLNIAGNAVSISAAAETAGSVYVNASAYQEIASVSLNWGSETPQEFRVFFQFKSVENKNYSVRLKINGTVWGGVIGLRGADSVLNLGMILPTGITGTSATFSIEIQRDETGANTELRLCKVKVEAQKR